jgi:1-acyl-sn-glycerol-3-phosphate acyltransferase
MTRTAGRGSGGVLRVVYSVTRLLIRPRLFGLGGEPLRGAAVYVANHSGAFGPIVVMSSLPFKVYPWVTFEITEPATCAAYLDEDFTGGELRLGPLFSRCLARLLSPVCVRLMKMVGAVPVYKNSRKIASTLDRSRKLLAAGGKLVIFPEKPGQDSPGPVGELDSGFINLARSYYAKQGRALPFYPVAVNRRARSLTVGAPLVFDPRRPFAAEKRRIRRQLEKRIAGLCGGGG